MKAIRSIRVIRVIRGLIPPTVFCLLTPVFCSQAQCTFTSGSTGADGAFTPTNSMPSTGWSISNNVVTVTNAANGVFNFTSIYIETNWVVKFTKNTLNTPVYLLATTNVTINGMINIDGADRGTPSGGIGGPGGYDGGSASALDSPGHGPGFGDNCSGAKSPGFARSIDPYCSPLLGGQAYGTIDLVPLIGGSGGGGHTSDGGGGGGGAILIASSGTITVNGAITSNGGKQGNFSGGGTGGAIKLMANTIAGEGLVQARQLNSNNAASEGRIRIESCVSLRNSLSDPPATFGAPTTVFLATNPTIRVTSIAGTNTPAVPAGSLTIPDVYLPTNNPAVISVSASNVNPGTTFKVIIIPSYGTNIVATNTLVGTYGFSSNTVSMSVYTDRVWRVNALINYIPRP